MKTKIIIQASKIALISRCRSGGYSYVLGNAVATQNRNSANYQRELADYNAKQTEYQRKLASYQSELAKYKSRLNSDQILSSEILQTLDLGSEGQATATVKLLKPLVSDDNGYGVEDHRSPDTYLSNALPSSNGTVAIQSEPNGYFLVHLTNQYKGTPAFEVTYTNLHHSMYNGRPISKITATYAVPTPINIFGMGSKDNNGDNIGYVAIAKNPYLGEFFFGVDGVEVDYHYYDASGNLITFNDNSNGGGAWVTIGSLNRSDQRTEASQLQSSGKAYGFYGSPVQPSSGNFIYATTPNDVPNKYGEWDTGLDNPKAYLGAGVYNVTGDHVKVSYFTTYQNGGSRNAMWATISTTIPTDQFNLPRPGVPPIAPNQSSTSASYHYDVAKLTSILRGAASPCHCPCSQVL